MSTTIATSNPEVKPEVKQAPKYGDFGKGRMSSQMTDFYKLAKRIFKLSDAATHKLTQQVASDFGSVMAKADVKWGRTKAPNKEGMLTLKEMASKVKGVYCTNALSCLVAVQYAEEAFKHGFHMDNTQWAPNENIQPYLDGLES